MSSIEPFQLMGRVIPKLKASMAAIDKFKKSRSIAKGRIWKQRHAESKRKLKVFLTRQEDVEEFERREAERNTRRWRLQEQQEAQRREEHAAWLKSRPARPVTPSASKSPEKVAETPVVTETPEERQRFINDRLTVILGEERMQEPAFLPSGNNPLDPAIVELNTQQFQNTVLNEWEAYKAAQIREAEEIEANQRQIEANRQQIIAKVLYYRERYLVRLEKLVSYGPQLDTAITLFGQVLLPYNEQDAAAVVYTITWELLNPIQDLLNERAKEMPLEEVGAQELQNAWPMNRMDLLFDFLNRQAHVLPEVADMGHRLKAVMQAVYNPTPFDDPLASKPAGFDLKAFNEAMQRLQDEQFRKRFEASCPPPYGIPTVPTHSSPKTALEISIARTAVLSHALFMASRFEDCATYLVRNVDGRVDPPRRDRMLRYLAEILKEANGCKGLLRRRQGEVYHNSLEIMRGQLSALTDHEKQHRETAKLLEKVDAVWRLWT
ncbi:hypothetical protein PtrEW13061_005776 [Pyrenophora tritici-repentis]|nr:hypothetical protein PtrEW13061_005776 [Pyrenophora tritici-repentis]